MLKDNMASTGTSNNTAVAPQVSRAPLQGGLKASASYAAAQRVPIENNLALLQAAQKADPATLARIALDEELKKRGGGGGGGFRSFNPNLFISYSFSLMAEKMQELAALFSKILDQAPTTNNLINQANPNTPAQGILGKIQTLGQNTLANFTNTLSQMASNTSKLAKSLLSNFATLGTAITSILANRLAKLFGIKDLEDEAQEKLKENQIDEDEDTYLTFSNSFFGISDQDTQNNERMIVSHIKNMADQIYKFVNSLTR